MKKTLLLAVAVSLLTIFCVASPVQARQHIVKKGEYLGSIAKKYNVNINSIIKANRQIKKRNLIFVGQKLYIPEKDSVVVKADTPIIWKVGGINPFGNRSFFKAMEKDLFDRLPEPVKANFIEDVKKGKSYPYRMKPGQMLPQQIYDKYKCRNDVEVQLPEDQLDAELYSKVEFDGYVYFLIKPLICDNWSWFREQKPAAPIPPVVVEQPKKELPQAPQVPDMIKAEPIIVVVPEVVVQPKPEEKCQGGKCRTDLIVGVGGYKNSHPDQDASGWYVWDKFRVRCLIGRIGDTDFYGGLALFIAGGKGHDRNYNYDWNEGTLGPSLKFINPIKHYDGDVEVMGGFLNNNGGEEEYESAQEDYISIVSAHLNYFLRRAEGKNLFPEIELNAEWRHIFNSNHKHSYAGDSLTPDPSDNEAYEFTVNQAIYDFRSGNWRFTPSLKLGVGKEFNLSQRDLASDGLINYGQIMPNLQIAHKGDKIINLAAGYKEIFGGDGDQLQIALTVDLTEKINKWWNQLKK
jgi:LysM repeat protein